MTLARLPPESVRIFATERTRCACTRLGWTTVGLLPPLGALGLALLPAALGEGLAAILCGAAVLLCGPMLLGRLLDAPQSGQGRRVLSGTHQDVLEGRP